MKIILFLLVISLVVCSCLRHESLYKGSNPEDLEIPQYLYPFNKEDYNVTAEITIQTHSTNPNEAEISIPHLKYNKSWLFTLTQDDCKQAAYSYTWAAINGRPLSKKYFYDARHYLNKDLPPDTYYLGKTLGSTDGTGNEVRFSFTTTVSPEWDFMNITPEVSPNLKQNYYRFFMKSGLIWEDLKDMMNYGTSIAYHDVNTKANNNIDSIAIHFGYAQDSIRQHLSGRGCKMLAEPNGNKTYIEAAKSFAPIQLMVAQTEATRLFPFQVENDLRGQVLSRTFADIPYFKQFIASQLQKAKENREAVCVGVHGTGTDWVEFLLWLNDQYGKDGDDSMWFTSWEEYYEYNYYRIHSTIQKTKIDEHTLKLKINLPSEEYFYYPSITLNLEGLYKADIVSITVNNAITGLSYGDYEKGLMINMDCRKYLQEHATHFVEEYQKNPTSITKQDALYFTNMLKASPQKEALLKRIK